MDVSPEEILEKIFRGLTNTDIHYPAVNIASLASVCIVSRTWNRIATPLLYQSVNLEIGDHHDGTDHKQGNLQQLVTTMANRPACFLKTMRLVVRYIGTCDTTDGIDEATEAQSQFLISNMPNLQLLDLRNIPWSLNLSFTMFPDSFSVKHLVFCLPQVPPMMYMPFLEDISIRCAALSSLKIALPPTDDEARVTYWGVLAAFVKHLRNGSIKHLEVVQRCTNPLPFESLPPFNCSIPGNALESLRLDLLCVFNRLGQVELDFLPSSLRHLTLRFLRHERVTVRTNPQSRQKRVLLVRLLHQELIKLGAAFRTRFPVLENVNLEVDYIPREYPEFSRLLEAHGVRLLVIDRRDL